nr:hypothetical protein [Anaerovibrio lipolyticus]
MSEMCSQWKDIPVYVGCSGNFTVERILAKKGLTNIHSNDVSLYSCAVGNYLVGKPTRIEVADERFAWLNDYLTTGEDVIATLLMCSEYFKYVDRELPYYKRIAEAYRDQFDRMQKETVEVVKRALEDVYIAGFHPQDVIDYMREAPEECVAISFPPTYKGGYEKLYAKINEVFDWDVPEYVVFDDERFTEFNELIMGKKYWVTLRDYDVEDLRPFLRGVVQTSARSKPVYVYSNCESKCRITMPHQKTEKVNIKRATGELKGDLRFVKITQAQLNTLRSEYLAKSIIPATATASYGVLVGDELIGAIAMSRSSYLGGWVDAYMMSDFCIRPSIHKRLAKLVLVAALSTEMRDTLEQALAMKVNTIGTTVFTKKNVSMKYRGMFEVYSKKDGAINYVAKAGRWTLKEGYEWWRKNHSLKW